MQGPPRAHPLLLPRFVVEPGVHSLDGRDRAAARGHTDAGRCAPLRGRRQGRSQAMAAVPARGLLRPHHCKAGRGVVSGGGGGQGMWMRGCGSVLWPQRLRMGDDATLCLTCPPKGVTEQGACFLQAAGGFLAPPGLHCARLAAAEAVYILRRFRWTRGARWRGCVLCAAYVSPPPLCSEYSARRDVREHCRPVLTSSDCPACVVYALPDGRTTEFRLHTSNQVH